MKKPPGQRGLFDPERRRCEHTLAEHEAMGWTCDGIAKDEAEPVAHARNSDPETSHEAAASVTKIRPFQEAVLRVVREVGPVTLEKLVWHYEHLARVEARREPCPDRLYPTQSPSGIRTRLSELVARGRAEWTGEYHVTTAGRRARLWRAR